MVYKTHLFLNLMVFDGLTSSEAGNIVFVVMIQYNGKHKYQLTLLHPRKLG